MNEKDLHYHDDWPLRTYLFGGAFKNGMSNFVSSILNQNNDSDNEQDIFVRSPTFSVQAAMLGSGTAFQRHFPKTGEDVFMLIHQNALMVVSTISASLLFGDKQAKMSNALYVPTVLKEAMQYFENDEYKKQLSDVSAGIPSRLGISYTADAIEIFYNIPLNNHSLTVQIQYNNYLHECTIAVQFLGESRARWETIGLLANMSADLSPLRLAQPVTIDTKAGMVSWSWVVNSPAAIAMVGQYICTMGRLSFGGSLQLSDLCVYTKLETILYKFDALIAKYKNQYQESSVIQNVLDYIEKQLKEIPEAPALPS